jgi:hypothetical protein
VVSAALFLLQQFNGIDNTNCDSTINNNNKCRRIDNDNNTIEMNKQTNVSFDLTINE